MKANGPKRKVFQDAVDLISPEAVNVVDSGQAMISVKKVVPFHNHPFRLYEGRFKSASINSTIKCISSFVGSIGM